MGFLNSYLERQTEVNKSLLGEKLERLLHLFCALIPVDVSASTVTVFEEKTRLEMQGWEGKKITMM